VSGELVVDGILPRRDAMRRCCPAPASCWIGWMVEQEEVGIGGDCLGMAVNKFERVLSTRVL
jgi:hypothetical protein